MWKTRSTPFSARRTARRSSTSHSTASYSRSSTFSVRARGLCVRRRSSPLLASSRTTWEPTKPLPPVTSVFAKPGRLDPRRDAAACVVLALVPDAADRLGHRVEALLRDLLAAHDAGPVLALGEPQLRFLHAPLLLLEDQVGGLVELL